MYRNIIKLEVSLERTQSQIRTSNLSYVSCFFSGVSSCTQRLLPHHCCSADRSHIADLVKYVEADGD